MKKTVLSILPVLLLLIAPISALATLITYTGSGYINTTTANESDTFDVSIALQISDQPTDWSTGQPVQINQFYNGKYSFDIANWFMYISGIGNYSGKSGAIYIEKLDLPNGLGDVMWFLNYEPMTEPHNESGPFWAGLEGDDYFKSGILPQQLTLFAEGWGQALFPQTDIWTSGKIDVSAVPEPSLLMLLGSGIAGFTWFITRRKRKSLS